MAALLPGMMGLSDGQQRLFLLSLTLIHRFRGDGLEAARDVDVADAAGALASTYETESKGLIYEHRAGSLPAQRMATELRVVLDKVGREQPSAFVRDAAAVLRRLEQLARGAAKTSPGDPLFFLNLVGRVADRISSVAGASAASEPADGSETTGRPAIIMP